MADEQWRATKAFRGKYQGAGEAFMVWPRPVPAVRERPSWAEPGLLAPPVWAAAAGTTGLFGRSRPAPPCQAGGQQDHAWQEKCEADLKFELKKPIYYFKNSEYI